MGDPKFLRRTFDTPKHPWEAGRMEQEAKLLTKYGLKNKKELWKAQSILRGFRRQARDLQARLRAGEEQAKRESDGLLGRLTRLGLLPPGSPTLDDVLALTLEELLARRFQSVVTTRGLAPTPNGARQLIVHGHLSIRDHRVTRPGYLVLAAEEGQIAYAPGSPLNSDDHAIRVGMRERATAAAAVPDTPPAEPTMGA